MICLCSNCIEAIRSRGERVLVGETMYFETEFDETVKCEWCEDDYDPSDVYKCYFE